MMKQEAPAPGDDFARAFEAQGRALAERILAENRAPQTWFSQREAAEYCRCSAPHFCSLHTSGRGPRFVPFGGQLRYRRDWLDAWVEAGGAGARDA